MDDPNAEKPLRFYSGFWPVWRVTTFWSAALAALALIGISAARGWQLNGWQARVPELLIISFSAVACGVLVAIAVVCFPIYVQKDGLRCYDFFGKYRLAPWQTITGGRPASLFGLRYLRVEAPELPRPQWLPLFLSDMDGFMQAVFDRTGPGHPLIVALESSR